MSNNNHYFELYLKNWWIQNFQYDNKIHKWIILKIHNKQNKTKYHMEIMFLNLIIFLTNYSSSRSSMGGSDTTWENKIHSCRSEGFNPKTMQDSRWNLSESVPDESIGSFEKFERKFLLVMGLSTCRDFERFLTFLLLMGMKKKAPKKKGLYNWGP